MSKTPRLHQVSTKISKLIERNREHFNTISGEDLLLILTENDGLVDRNF